jgi:anti-sigma B factor antagonist
MNTAPVNTSPATGTLSIDRTGSRAVMTMTGEFDTYTVDLVAGTIEDLLRDRPDVLIVDMSAVEFIDSSGLAMLVRVHKQVVQNGRGTLTVAQPSPITRRLLEVCGLLETFGLDGHVPLGVTNSNHTPARLDGSQGRKR